MRKQARQSLTSPEDLQSWYEAHVLLLAVAILYLLSYQATWVLNVWKCESDAA